jgi:hypothetical protein
MEFSNEFRVAMPLDRAWETLTDLEQVAAWIPGAELLGVDDGVHRGELLLKIGPIHVRYSGEAVVTQRDDDARHLVITATGTESRDEDAAQTVAVLAVECTALRDGTQVFIESRVDVKGRVADFGQGILQDVADRLVQRFADEMREALTLGQPPRPLAEERTPSIAPPEPEERFEFASGLDPMGGRWAPHRWAVPGVDEPAAASDESPLAAAPSEEPTLEARLSAARRVDPDAPPRPEDRFDLPPPPDLLEPSERASEPEPAAVPASLPESEPEAGLRWTAQEGGANPLDLGHVVTAAGVAAAAAEPTEGRADEGAIEARLEWHGMSDVEPDVESESEQYGDATVEPGVEAEPSPVPLLAPIDLEPGPILRRRRPAGDQAPVTPPEPEPAAAPTPSRRRFEPPPPPGRGQPRDAAAAPTAPKARPPRFEPPSVPASGPDASLSLAAPPPPAAPRLVLELPPLPPPPAALAVFEPALQATTPAADTVEPPLVATPPAADRLPAAPPAAAPRIPMAGDRTASDVLAGPDPAIAGRVAPVALFVVILWLLRRIFGAGER